VLPWQTSGAAESAAGETYALLEALREFPHARQVAFTDSRRLDYEVGLGAIRKERGAWVFKESERLSGRLRAYTWQIVDGFSSVEVYRTLQEQIAAVPDAELLFACDGRDCGPGVQWANRVFHQRILYGRDDQQHYVVYRLGEGARLLLYSAARTTERQYLHAALLSPLEAD
jgi:hypothetical protein